MQYMRQTWEPFVPQPKRHKRAARAAGDIDIAAFQPTPEKILGFHQETKRLEAARETPGMRMPLRPLPVGFAPVPFAVAAEPARCRMKKASRQVPT
jgi:hypothetical protein